MQQVFNKSDAINIYIMHAETMLRSVPLGCLTISWRISQDLRLIQPSTQSLDNLYKGDKSYFLLFS